MNRKTSKRIVHAVSYLALGIGAVIMLVPLIWAFTTSLKTTNEAFVYPPTFFGKEILWSNYLKISDRFNFLNMFKNTSIVTIASVILQLTTSAMAGFAFSYLKFRGRDRIFMLFLFSMMVPTVTNLIPQFLLMKDMKLVDSYLGLLLIYIGIGVPQNTFFLRNFFLGLPKELEEAVIIDGGNRWQIYWKMVLPLSKPALGTFAILAYSNVWDEFLIALTMIKTPEKRTLPIALRLFQGQNLNNWGLIFAASLIAVVPILLIYIVMQKKLIHGGAMDGMLKG